MSDKPKVPQVFRRILRNEAWLAFKNSGYALSQVEEWCEENYVKYEADTPKRLKAWCVDEALNEVARAKLESFTDAQKQAHLVGATLPKALSTLVDTLTATKTKILFNRQGEETGRIDSPDHEARISASKEILRVLGAYAPEQMQIFAGPMEEFSKKTEEELERELKALRKSTGNPDPAGVEGEKGREGLPLLAAGSDENERRTGSGESVQAIPKKAVLQAMLERDGQRTN